MRKLIAVFLMSAAFLTCSKDEMKHWTRYNLPERFSNSHILSIDTKGDAILIGTFGYGALFSENGGGDWAVFDTGNGLSWNFILGGDWDGDYLILATLGDGLNICP